LLPRNGISFEGTKKCEEDDIEEVDSVKF
jgi:hypothetical protein